MKKTRFTQAARKTGALLKSIRPREHQKMDPSWSLTTRTFMNKLVAPEILKGKLSIHYDGYFKGLLAVEHFALVLAGDLRVLDNLNILKNEIGKNNSKPMLSLDLVLVALGAWSYELSEEHFRQPDVARRAAVLEEPPSRSNSASSTFVDPYYLALGEMIAGLVGDWRRTALKKVETSQELKALVFVDAVLGLTKAASVKKLVAAGEFLSAACRAAEALRQFSTPEVLRQQLETALAKK